MKYGKGRGKGEGNKNLRYPLPPITPHPLAAHRKWPAVYTHYRSARRAVVGVFRVVRWCRRVGRCCKRPPLPAAPARDSTTTSHASGKPPTSSPLPPPPRHASFNSHCAGAYSLQSANFRPLSSMDGKIAKWRR